MLQLVIGTAGTGKSVFIKEKIQCNAKRGGETANPRLVIHGITSFIFSFQE